MLPSSLQCLPSTRHVGTRQPGQIVVGLHALKQIAGLLMGEAILLGFHWGPINSHQPLIETAIWIKTSFRDAFCKITMDARFGSPASSFRAPAVVVNDELTTRCLDFLGCSRFKVKQYSRYVFLLAIILLAPGHGKQLQITRPLFIKNICNICILKVDNQ